MEILEEQEERLDLTFPQQEPLDRLQDPLPALRRVEGAPRVIVDGDIQQRQERRQERLQRPVQRQELDRHSFANLPLVVALLDPQICLQQLDDGQVRRRPPIGYRAVASGSCGGRGLRLRGEVTVTGARGGATVAGGRSC